MKNRTREDLYQKRIEKMKEMQIKLQGRKMVSRNIPVAKKSKVILQTAMVQPMTLPTRNFITLDVVQGLGDIFWIYQKFAPFYNNININICVVVLDNIQNRSLSWMPLFPKVRNVRLRLVEGSVYDSMASTKYKLDETIALWNEGIHDSVPYAINKWLETGTRIDEIDDHKIENYVNLKTEEFKVPCVEYITLYVSGSAKNRNLPCWSTDEWIEYVKEIYEKYDLKLPIIVIGANFDKEAILDIIKGLSDIDIINYHYMNDTPERVCHIMKNSKLFIGYQSGLNIIAENFDIPQVMLYYEHLKDMMYTWCKKENIEKKFFADLFSNTPKSVAQKFDLRKFLK